MEKKLLTEILRIKELIGGKNLLTEETLPVKILRALSSIFKNESDDVVKKIIKSNDNLVTKLKNGNLNPKEADLIIKNAGGLEAFYYKTARETFNQKNYKDFYTDFQTLKNTGTMDKMYIYSEIIDQDIPKLLPNAGEGYRTEMKNMLKDDLRTYIDNKTKTNPFLQDDVPNNKKVKPEPTVVKNNKMLGYEINKAIEDAFVNKEIPKKHIQKFKDEFEKAVIKQVDKIPKETIDKLDFCIKELDKMEGLDRQDLVEKIIRNYEALTKQNMPLRDKQRLKNFLLGKDFSKGEDWEEKGMLFLKHWFSKCLYSTGIYGASYVADMFAEAHGNEKAKELMYDKGDTAWYTFIFRILGGPFGLLYTIIMEFIPSMFNTLIAASNSNKDDRKLLKKGIDKGEMFLFKGELILKGVLSTYIDLITINKDGLPVYTYKGTQYEIYDLSVKEPTKAHIIVDDKTFYLTGPQFKK